MNDPSKSNSQVESALSGTRALILGGAFALVKAVRAAPCRAAEGVPYTASRGDRHIGPGRVGRAS